MNSSTHLSEHPKEEIVSRPPPSRTDSAHRNGWDFFTFLHKSILKNMISSKIDQIQIARLKEMLNYQIKIKTTLYNLIKLKKQRSTRWLSNLKDKTISLVKLNQSVLWKCVLFLSMKVLSPTDKWLKFLIGNLLCSQPKKEALKTIL